MAFHIAVNGLRVAAAGIDAGCLHNHFAACLGGPPLAEVVGEVRPRASCRAFRDVGVAKDDMISHAPAFFAACPGYDFDLEPVLLGVHACREDEATGGDIGLRVWLASFDEGVLADALAAFLPCFAEAGVNPDLQGARIVFRPPVLDGDVCDAAPRGI